MRAYPTANATTTTAKMDPIITALLFEFEVGSVSGAAAGGVTIWPVCVGEAVVFVERLVEVAVALRGRVGVGVAVVLGKRMGQDDESVQNSPQIWTDTTAGGGWGVGDL